MLFSDIYIRSKGKKYKHMGMIKAKVTVGSYLWGGGGRDEWQGPSIICGMFIS